MDDLTAPDPDRTPGPGDPHVSTSLTLELESLTTRLVEAARTARTGALRAARQDAVTLVSALAYEMPDVAQDVIDTWTRPDGRADARTWVFAEEVLLLGAMLASARHRAARLPVQQFPVLRTAARGWAPQDRMEDLVAQLFTARVRGDAARVDLVLSAYLCPTGDPDSTRLLLLSLGMVAALAAKTEAADTGRPVSEVLGHAGMAAAA